MKITYYGTGASTGIPEIFCSCRICEHARAERGKNIRTRSQAVIDGRLGIDFSVDSFLHTVFYGLDMRQVRHIVITHDHVDHLFAPDLYSRAQGMDTPLHIYATENSLKGVRGSIERREEAYRSGRKKRTFDFVTEAHTLAMLEPMNIMDYEVIALPARHALSLDSAILLIRSQGKNVLWAHDTGLFFDEVWAYLEAHRPVFDLVSLDCTLKRGEQITPSHMDLDWCLQVKERMQALGCINGSTKVILSHIGHLVERTHEELVEEAAPYGMTVAFDGMTVEI